MTGDDLGLFAEIIRRLGLDILIPLHHACEILAGENPPLEVALLGQFKSGKSSLLNGLLGENIFPVGVLPVTAAIGYAFGTHWDLLWWLLPMWLVGGLFRRHVLGLVDWEVEKNLTRLAGDWADATIAAVADLRNQAQGRAERELATLMRLLTEGTTETSVLRDFLNRLPAHADRVQVESSRGAS